ncbi:MAG TPA: rhodanese-like domain-containing protein [Ignavibacteria bacterium]|nr:rhodanese-like domain-containing protein [Ignavibacteria bacterium]
MKKQILIIIGICVVVSLAANFISPKGIPLFIDESRYEEGTPNVNNNTSQSNNLGNLVANPNYDKKLGFVKPQNIGFELTRQLHDKNVLFIDGRKKEEFILGHIPGSINLPYEEFYVMPEADKKSLLSKYKPDDIMVVYCGGGECEVSIDLAYEIAKIGFNSTNIYRGGYKEWVEKGNPVSK